MQCNKHEGRIIQLSIDRSERESCGDVRTGTGLSHRCIPGRSMSAIWTEDMKECHDQITSILNE